MRRMIRILALCLLGALLGGCAAEQATASAPRGDAGAVPTVTLGELSKRLGERGEDPGAVRLFAVNVGKGDALILRVGDYACLIDTGKTWAKGKVSSALAAMLEGTRLDAVFLTHIDDDHTGGLRWLAAGDGIEGSDSIAWYASAYYAGVKAAKHPAVRAAGDVTWLERGDSIPLGDTGAVLRVLAPASLHEDKDDNNSLVMLLESDQGRLLLTGDMELPEEAELLAFGDDLSCDVLKVPNHGDDDTTSAEFAKAAGAKLAVVSTDSQQKPGTPDPGVVSRLEAAGSRVLATQDADLGILITLSQGVAAAEYVAVDAPLPDGPCIREVDAGDDRVLLGNRADERCDLGGWYLYSDKGDELFTFPDGAALEPGGTLVVGTNSTDGGYDLLWDDKKVVNKKKTDTFYLYDRWGRIVDALGNGR